MRLKILLLLILGLLYLSNLGLNDIWQPNEAFYAETSRELLESGNYLNLTYNYEPRLEKPPLTYWLTALSYKTLGVNELTTRLVPLLSVLFTAATLIFYGKFLRSFSFGLTASLIFLSSVQIFALGRYDSPEMPLTFFLSTSLIFLHIYLLKNSFLTIALSGIFLALTLLTKGIPFLTIYWGTLILFLLLKKFLYKETVNWKNEFAVPIIVSFVASLPILGWYFYAYLHYGELFIKVFQNEVLHRALNPEKAWNFYFYFVVILWAFFPFSLIFYYSLPGLILKLKQYKDFAFSFSWFVTVLTAFTLAKGKIPVYILPAFPAMALLTARLAEYRHIVLNLLIAFTSLLALSGALFVTFWFDFYKSWELWLILLLTIALMFAVKEHFVKPLVATVPFFAIFSLYILPKVEKYRPYKEVLTKLKRKFPTYKLAVLGHYYHNFPFYWKGKVYKLKSLSELKKLNPSRVLLFSEKPLKGWKIVKTVKLYKGSESRFMVFLKDIKTQKRFGTFYFQVKD